jgi:CheY-like chemotaxis protein
VLIAEDDGVLRQALRCLLEGQGYTCAETGDGREAIELARQHPPRCVLLDLDLPGLDGFAVARSLRSDPRTQGAHIHCVTGLADPQSRRQAGESGCEMYLLKPIDPVALLEAVRGPLPPPEESSIQGLSPARAEELLDWLENHGCTRMQVSLEANGLTVHCTCPPGFRLVQDDRGIRLERS